MTTNQILATVEMASLVILPLILFYQRSSWTRRDYLISVILLPIIWFSTYALLHEISHMIGAYWVGLKIIDYRLIPEFWKGDFSHAWVNTSAWNSFQGFVVLLSPYLRDILFLITGLVILERQKSRHAFVAGLIYVMFFLSPLFDLANNFSGYVIEKYGDFNALSFLIGSSWAYTIGLAFSGIAILLVLGVLSRYKGLPGKPVL